jgi:serine/threonine-protein kinase
MSGEAGLDTDDSAAAYVPSDADVLSQLGPFRVLRHLARSGASEVLLALAVGPYGFERRVALKVLLPRFRDDPLAAEILAREAGALARLGHPAIIRLYDFISDGRELALVLEYVDGMPLNTLRSELYRRGEVLSDGASLYLASRLFAALAHAHDATDPRSGAAAPVVHGGVCPSKLLVPWDGYAKLIDFATPRVPSEFDDRFGTPRTYLSPQQARGECATSSSDVYSGCLVLWELLTARRAFPRGRLAPAELLAAMAEPRLPTLAMLRPDLPSALKDIVDRGLVIDPDRHALKASEVHAVLNREAELARGRLELVEAIGALRLTRLHSDPLDTTPNLPHARAPSRASEPEECLERSRTIRPDLRITDRPVALASRGPLAKSSLKALAGAAGAGLVLACAVAFTWSRAARQPPPGYTVIAALSATAVASPPARMAASNSASPQGLDGPHPTAAPSATVDPTLETAMHPPAANANGGFIAVPASRFSHRVWIDGRLVGESPGVFPVSCAVHSVRVGSRGALQQLRVDCGSTVQTH